MAQTKITEAIAKQENNKLENAPKKNLLAKIEKMAPAIKAALPTVITPERFTRMVLSAVSSNPKLQQCEPNSFLGAMMQAAQLGLEPNTPLGQAYIIPYNDRKRDVLVAQFQIGYKGLIDLAYRSGQVTIIDAQVVYENDEFEYELGLEPKLKHKPALENRGNPKLYYAMFRTKDGGFGFQVMSYADCAAHARRFSKSYSDGPWKTNFDEMAKKTVLKKALKYAPLKSDFSRQLNADDSVKSVIEENMVDLPSESAVDAVPDEVVEYTDYTVDESTGEAVPRTEESWAEPEDSTKLPWEDAEK